MRQALRVVPNAEREIRAAAAWWYENRPAARDLFHQELARGFDLITTQPGVGGRARDTTMRGIRRLALYKIHYYLYYRATPDTVEVLALWHTSRGEGPAL